MPKITTKRIGVAVDMFGCPNRCRHCYLGFAPNARMSDDDLRHVARQFRNYVQTAGTIESLTISSSLREPDFSDDYRHLHELEKELSDEDPARYELLSIWRLARDKDYAKWAKSLHPQACQITFFGMEETTDWFYRRKGAFRDALAATERLLEVGMKPRWQIFVTKRLIHEIDGMMDLVHRLRLRERVQALGGEFQVFMGTPVSIGEGYKIEHLRPTIEEAANLPEDILSASMKHLGKQTLWQPESDLYKAISENEQARPADESLVEPSRFWFFVTSAWDVFSNVGTLDPWWRLGNLKTDSVETIMRRFERDDILGLQVLLHHSQRGLAEQYGQPRGEKIYDSRTDLLDLYVARHCERLWESGVAN